MTDVVLVRPAGDADLAGVLALRPGLRGTGPPTPRETATWSRIMATPDLVVYVAELAAEVVGTATVMAMPNVTYDCAPTLFVEAVLVRPTERRRGIASAILAEALADAERNGCNKVQLLSHKRHAFDGAHDLYTKLGFEAEAEGFRLYLQGNT